MDYIFFNHDGSVKLTKFTDSINQNSDGVNKIFVSSSYILVSECSALGVFVLPDGTVSIEVGEAVYDFEYETGKFADGYVITLTQSETVLAGIVRLTIQIKETATERTLYTYRVPLTVNTTAEIQTYVNITLAQYQNVINYINSLKTWISSQGYVTNDDLDSYVPYTGATENVDLSTYRLAAGYLSSSGLTIFGSYSTDYSFTIKFNTSREENNQSGIRLGANGSHLIYQVLDSAGDVAQNRQVANTDELPKQGVCATFDTGSFTADPGDGHYFLNNIPVSNFIVGSNMLIITWGNCFALCPIPQTGSGRVVAAMWDANGEAKTIRVRYQLKDDNTKLDINLQGGFQPPADYTGYVQCIKLFS